MEVKKKKVNWMTVLLFVVICMIFMMSWYGDKLYDRVHPPIDKVRPQRVMSDSDGKDYLLLPKECVKDQVVYEIVEEEGFFVTNIKVKPVPVETADYAFDEDYLIILTGVDNDKYYAIIQWD